MTDQQIMAAINTPKRRGHRQQHRAPRTSRSTAYDHVGNQLKKIDRDGPPQR